MSIKVATLVWERYPEGGGELLLALALADFADDDGGSIYPSVAKLSVKTRQSRRTVQYQLRKMEESGWLRTVRYGSGGRGLATEYRIPVDEIRRRARELADDERIPEMPAPGDDPQHSAENNPQNNPQAENNPQAKGANPAPFQQKGAIHDKKGRNPRHKRAQSTTQKGATAIAPQPSLTVIEPSVESPSRSARRTRLPADFQITPALRAWYARRVERDGWPEGLLDEHLEAFLRKARATGYKYIDWNQAFQNSVIDDWSGVRRRAMNSAPGQRNGTAWWATEQGTLAKGEEMGIRPRPGESWGEFRNRIYAALEPRRANA